MEMSYNYKLALVEEVDKINGFNNIGRSAWMNEFFSVEKQKSFLAECLYGDEVIGTEGYVEYEMNYKGNTVVTHRSERTLVSGNHRGKGIFDNLVKLCDENGKKHASKMCWGSTTALKAFSNVGFEKYTGFRSHFYFPVAHNVLYKTGNIVSNFKLFNPVKAYKSYKNMDLLYLKKLLSFYSSIKGAQKVKNSNIELVDFNADEANKIVLEETKNKNIFSIRLTDSLFKWLGNRGKKYTSYQLKKNGQNIGHVTFFINEESHILHIVDLFFTDGAAITEVLAALSKKYRNSGILSIFIALNDENEYHSKWINALKKHSVFSKGGAGSFVIKNLHHDKERMNIGALLLSDLWLEL